jgi:hypothetical protein
MAGGEDRFGVPKGIRRMNIAFDHFIVHQAIKVGPCIAAESSNPPPPSGMLGFALAISHRKSHVSRVRERAKERGEPLMQSRRQDRLFKLVAGSPRLLSLDERGCLGAGKSTGTILRPRSFAPSLRRSRRHRLATRPVPKNRIARVLAFSCFEKDARDSAWTHSNVASFISAPAGV